MGRPPIFAKRMTTAERVRRHRERKRASAPPKDTVASLRARCAGLEAELRRRGARSSTTTAAAGAARLEVEVAELRDENHKFRVELEAQNQVIKTRDGGGLTAAQFRKFEMVFHPDNSAGKETREWASRVFRQLRYVLCAEAELPSMDPKKFSTWARQQWTRRQRTIREVKKAQARRAKPARRPGTRPRVLPGK